MTTQTLAKSLLQKGVMKRKAGEKYKLTSLDPGLSEGMSAAGLFKAIVLAKARYIKRIPKPGGGYRYVYKPEKQGKKQNEGGNEAKELNSMMRNAGMKTGFGVDKFEATKKNGDFYLESMGWPTPLRIGGNLEEAKTNIQRHLKGREERQKTQKQETLEGKQEVKNPRNKAASLAKALLRKSYEGVVTGEYYGRVGDIEKKKPGTSAILGKDMDSSLAGNGNDMAMLAKMLNGGQPWRSGILY